MSKEVLITLPKRGLRVIPPEETKMNMLRARQGEVVTWTEEEKTRLKLLINCPILERRHPQPSDGQEYMKTVDYRRNEWLFSLAQGLCVDITNEWRSINPSQDIAVLLYGSVAKGLARRADQKDPSNIDIAVLGKISEEEKLKLFDSIRPRRINVQKEILGGCPHIDSPESNPGNAGVIIQDVEKVVKENYGTARGYIAARAVPLHDPAGIWKEIERNALRYAIKKYTKQSPRNA